MLLQNVSNFFQQAQNWFWKQEMELSNQEISLTWKQEIEWSIDEMELYLLLLHFQSEKFFYKMFYLLQKSSKLVLNIGNGIIQTGNGLISSFSWPPSSFTKCC